MKVGSSASQFVQEMFADTPSFNGIPGGIETPLFKSNQKVISISQSLGESDKEIESNDVSYFKTYFYKFQFRSKTFTTLL